MKYSIGIDGGATSSKCVITDEDLNIIYKCSGEATNILQCGVEKAVDIYLDLLAKCLIENNITPDKVNIIGIGAAGAGRKTETNRLKEKLTERLPDRGIKPDKLCIDSDARIALEGAFNGKQGAILISGTGSIIFGKDSGNKIHRAGGFGRNIGDEGSGYSIGRKAFGIAAKSFDGRTSDSLLTSLLKEKLNLKQSSDLIDLIHSDESHIASAAPIVFEAAEGNDETALRILNDEIHELLQLIIAIKTMLVLPRINLCLLGGLIQEENIYSKLLIEKINLEHKNVDIMKAQYPPEVGAIILSKNNL